MKEGCSAANPRLPQRQPGLHPVAADIPTFARAVPPPVQHRGYSWWGRHWKRGGFSVGLRHHRLLGHQQDTKAGLPHYRISLFVSERPLGSSGGGDRPGTQEERRSPTPALVKSTSGRSSYSAGTCSQKKEEESPRRQFVRREHFNQLKYLFQGGKMGGVKTPLHTRSPAQNPGPPLQH